VNVWIAIGPNGIIGPVWIKKKNTGSNYRSILDANIKGVYRYYDDGAGCHITSEVCEFFFENGVERVRDSLQLSPKSYESNITEDLWAIGVQRVYAGNRYFSSVTELFTRIEKVYSDMKLSGEDKHLYKELTARVPVRLSRMIGARGGPIQQKVTHSDLRKHYGIDGV
jgi:hypothetical protein